MLYRLPSTFGSIDVQIENIQSVDLRFLDSLDMDPRQLVVFLTDGSKLVCPYDDAQDARHYYRRLCKALTENK